jgi:hypothetical protein
MHAEALELMKLLQITDDSSVFSDFKEEQRVYVSEQFIIGNHPDGDDGSGEVRHEKLALIYCGVVWNLLLSAPAEERLQLIKKVEKEYGILVYHIHQHRPAKKRGAGLPRQRENRRRRPLPVRHRKRDRTGAFHRKCSLFSLSVERNEHYILLA